MANQVSTEFMEAVHWAAEQAGKSNDELVSFAIHYIPVYAQTEPTPQQARAGGCEKCTYLGLWSDAWPGMPRTEHGTIWLFENGIRKYSSNLYDQVLETLLHEIDHAVQRNHVLESLNQAKAEARAMAWPRLGCCE